MEPTHAGPGDRAEDGENRPIAFLPTPRLRLTRSTRGSLSALMSGDDEYERVYGHRVEIGFIEYPDMLVFTQHQALMCPEYQHWWLPYLMIHEEDDAVIGVCGYKGPPDGRGFVEIGYGIAPKYRGKGLTTEAAAALTGNALETNDVAGVRAHTMPCPGASGRILDKCGFARVGDHMDPEEGLLWRWERPKTPLTPAP